MYDLQPALDERTGSARGPSPLDAVNPLSLERRPAAAGRRDIGVRELETGAVSALDVVDLRLVQVLEAQRVDVKLHPMGFEPFVEVGRLVLEVEVVLEASAPSADDAEAKALAIEALGTGDFFDLVGGERGDRDHRVMVSAGRTEKGDCRTALDSTSSIGPCN